LVAVVKTLKSGSLDTEIINGLLLLFILSGHDVGIIHIHRGLEFN
jgi:hypothetical protein